jgi:transcriptional regulator with XRE-family HTH domain
MKIDDYTRSDLVLKELGRRIAQKRVRRNVSQEAFAQQSGISRSSLQRLEKGDGGTRLATFLAALRHLGVSEALNSVLPEEEASPIEVFDALSKVKTRKRASSSTRKAVGAKVWGDGTPMSGGEE